MDVTSGTVGPTATCPPRSPSFAARAHCPPACEQRRSAAACRLLRAGPAVRAARCVRGLLCVPPAACGPTLAARRAQASRAPGARGICDALHERVGPARTRPWWRRHARAASRRPPSPRRRPRRQGQSCRPPARAQSRACRPLVDRRAAQPGAGKAPCAQRSALPAGGGGRGRGRGGARAMSRGGAAVRADPPRRTST